MPEFSPGVASCAIGMCVAGGVGAVAVGAADMVSRETSPIWCSGADVAAATGAVGGRTGAADAALSAAAPWGATMLSAIGAKAISSRYASMVGWCFL